MGALDIVSSDAHATKRRRPIVSKALRILEDEIGAQNVDTIIGNSYKIIGNYPA